MPNELKIVNKGGASRTIIKVLQVCGYQPIIADVIDETMLLLISAIPKADNSAIDVTFTDVPTDDGGVATGYRIKRYVVGADPSTATTLIDWTEGVANALITDNGNGSHTFKDATAVLDVDYMYFYEAYNPVSEGVSNEIEASLFSTSFQPVMRTTLANETVTLPMTVTSPVTIDWGDGTTTTQGAPFVKTYLTAGDYHIKVNITESREVTNFRFGNTGDRLKLIEIKNWGWAKFGTIGGNFWGCANLEKITAEDTPRDLVNMLNFFNGCSKLNQIDNFNWDTSNVTSMQNWFLNCILFNLPVNQLNTANVTNMQSMFANCPVFNQPVSNFDTSNVTAMASMFQGCTVFNQSVLNFNTENVTNMSFMFQGASAFNQSVINFDTSKVTNMSSMFRNATVFNQSVSNFDTSKVTTMLQMFNNAIVFNQPVLFTIPLLTTAQSMFLGATAFNTTNMDNCLINFAGQTTLNNVNMVNNRPRTSASDSAVNILQSRGWLGLV
jgi:surface protein